jgi:TPR repeat protein
LEKSIAWGPNKEAYFDIAVCYETGKGTPKDLKKAFECYLLSALYGEPKAKYEVGRCYYYGIGVPKNIELGREICEQFPEK